MRLDKLAVTAQEAFQAAMGVAGDADAAVIEPIHLLKALLDSDENNLAARVPDRCTSTRTTSPPS